MRSENKYELIKFEDGDFSLDVNVSPNKETVWLNRIELSMLFDRDVKTIGKHINNILKEEYKNVTGVIANIATTPPYWIVFLRLSMAKYTTAFGSFIGEAPRNESI